MLLSLELAGQGIGDGRMHGVRLASALKAMYMPNCSRPQTQITYSGLGVKIFCLLTYGPFSGP